MLGGGEREPVPGPSGDLPAVFPDWSPYRDLDSAARAYLRDPDLALEALGGVLAGATVLGFTLERFVTDTNGVWQEVAVCDGRRLILWHGEDMPPGGGPPGAMASSVRVLPLSAVTEIGARRRLRRTPGGEAVADAVDVYVLLSSLDEASGDEGGDQQPRHDTLRFVKTVDDAGPGQVARLEEFARLLASVIGRPL